MSDLLLINEMVNDVYLSLDQIANNFVIKVVNGCPFDAFLDVLFLEDINKLLF